MSNFKRPAIVALAALAGAQLSAIACSPQPGQTSNDCLQWAQDAIGTATGDLSSAPPEAAMGYYDVRTKRDERL